jgi:membrane-associated phospholipid phosphatase
MMPVRRMGLRPHRQTALRCHPPAMPRAALLVVTLFVLLLAGWGAGELAESFQASDLQLVRDVAAQRSPPATTLAHALSVFGSSLLIGPLALVCCVALYVAYGPASSLAVALSVAGAAVILNVDKLIVGRPRPPVEHLEEASGGSFPSGHATISAAFYLALLIVFVSRSPRVTTKAAATAAAATLILAVAISRVYSGVHYVSDVLAGVFLGGTWTAVVVLLFGRTVSSAALNGGSVTR